MSGALGLLTEVLGYPPTAEQLAMVESGARATLVVAGAGSGKTETMANRVVWLCARPDDERILPEEVLGLTFTRKAAGELSARIGRRLRQAAQTGAGAHLDAATMGQPTVLTYDSYAGRLVREHGMRLGVEPDTELMSEGALWQLAQDVVSGYRGPTDLLDKAESTLVDGVMALAGQMAEHLREPAEVVASLQWHADRIESLGTLKKHVVDAVPLRERAQLVPMVAELVARMRERGALDFSQQKALAARLARDVPQVRAVERARYRAVLLDEFQDTSENQLVMLASLFAGSDLAVTAVGDPHQSIYGWRGASATTLAAFRERFATDREPVQTLTLATSWRNDETILEAANLVAAPLREGAGGGPVIEVPPLATRPGAGAGHVCALRAEDSVTHARQVVAWLDERCRRVEGRRRDGGPASAAVLCRRRADFGPVVQALQETGLPYEVVGLGGLLAMPEVADLVALLTVAQAPDRGDRLMRLLTGPVCRLGAADLDGLDAWARQLHREPGAAEVLAAEKDDDGEVRVTLVEAVSVPPPAGWVSGDGRFVSPEGRARLARLATAVERVRRAQGLSLPELVLVAERELGLDVEVLARPGYEGMTGRRHLDAFLDEVAGFAATGERPSLGGLIAWLEAAMVRERGLTPGEVDPEPGVVQVLTVHAAKGLEWDVVAVPGLAESRFPSHSSYTRKDDELGEWVVNPPSAGGWLVGVADIPYELRGDREGLPHLDLTEVADGQGVLDAVAEFKRAVGEHSVLEERRLAYVAFTRAREHLLLSTAVWEPGRSAPLVTSRFLEEVLGGMTERVEVLGWADMPALDATNPFDAEATRVPWPRLLDPEGTAPLRRGADAVLAARRAGVAPDEEAALVLADHALTQSMAGRAAEAVVLPARLSASAVIDLATSPEQFRARLRRPVPRPPRPAALAGTLVHGRIEEHFRSAALLALPSGLEREDDDLPGDALWERFLGGEWADRTPVDVEVALFGTIGAHRVTARVDAVFADGEDFVVVDWKSGREPRGEEMARRALQLAQYRVLYARHRGVPPERVRACFHYLASGRTVFPELPGEDELEALLST